MRISAAVPLNAWPGSISRVILNLFQDNKPRPGVLKQIQDDENWALQRGFTLVELMVVLAVLALAATVVILTIPGSNARVAQEADRLAVRIASLRDLAIVEGRPMALVVSPSGYAFERREASGWTALPGRGYARHDWPTGIRLSQPAGAAPLRVTFDTIGMTSARTSLSISDDETTARISVSATGEVVRGE
jgi:general secretion pathway protein H